MTFKTIFMGTSEFSVPALDALIKNKFNVIKVYTQSPKKSRRGQKFHSSPIEEFSKKNKLDFRNPLNLNTDEEFKIFQKISPDIVIVVAYGQMIPKIFLNTAKLGFINIHASLLPKWRGAAPIQRAIMNGDKQTRVSNIKIEEKLDSGPVLASKEIELDQKVTHGEIEKKLSIMGADLLVEYLKKADWIVDNVEEKPYTQNPYPPFITSTLQQDGIRKLHTSSKNIMRLAQNLYQSGYITYMRTDSITISKQAINQIRDIIKKDNPANLPDKPRTYSSKVKNAQEAHEAIRPAGDLVHPKKLKSKLDESDLEKVHELLQETESWLDEDDHSKSDYETKLNELNGDLQPIMMKAMSQGSEGFPANEAVPPQGGVATEGENVGPTINEVD